MLTLNQTSGNNSDSIWVMRLRGEGNNILTNGDFGSSDGWTLTGDWAISGGVADYTYIDDMTGSIYRTIPSVTAEPYILEYEIIENNTTTNILYLIGGGSYIISSAYMLLDASVGKHSITIKCVGSATTVGFYISGSAPGKRLKLDNVKLRKFDNIVYLSTRDINLTNNYSGQLLNKNNYISEIVFPSTISGSGGAGSVSSFSITISRYVSNNNLDGFFNEFYPAVDGGFIVGRVIDFGVCWIGATADTDITWLFRARVIDYNYAQRQLTLTAFQESEITNKELPYYEVQDIFNNNIGYYEDAPEDSFGKTIPIVYGELNQSNALPPYVNRFMPTVRVGDYIYLLSSHYNYNPYSPSVDDRLFEEAGIQ